MTVKYCTSNDVKRLLRTATKKIKTSESYRDLGYNDDNIGTIQLSGVTFLDSYVGVERFTGTFSDATHFSFVGEESGVLGDGSIGLTYTNNYFSISSNNWAGIAQANDAVYFTSNSNISNDDLEAYIVDATDYINSRLICLFGTDSTNIPWEADLTMTPPRGLRYACIRLASYEICAAILAGMEIDQAAPVYEWYRLAEKVLFAFIDDYLKEGQVSAPQWRSRTLLFDKLGISGVENGIIYTDEDVTDNTVYNRN